MRQVREAGPHVSCRTAFNHRQGADAKIQTRLLARERPIPALCTEADRDGSKFRAAREVPDAILVRASDPCGRQVCGGHAESCSSGARSRPPCVPAAADPALRELTIRSWYPRWT